MVYNYLLLHFHDKHIFSLLWLILGIVFFYGLAVFMIRENSKTFTHDMSMEMWWIFSPAVILMSIAIPSISFLYSIEDIAIVLNWGFKAMGHQWYWTYDFFSVCEECEEYHLSVYESYPTLEEEEENRNMTSENELVFPAFSHVRGLIGAKDVIHSWTLPLMSMKTDAIPGRLNQVELMSDEMGNLLYGQCSELCGVNHSFMPIIVKIS